MKIPEKFFISLSVIFIFIFSECLSQTPQYLLKVTNINQTLANELEFDIYLLHTNSDSSVFEYANGQYYFDFNALIANGGFFSYSIVNSDLPAEMQPRNPTVYLVGGAMQLRLASNIPPGAGSGFIISSTPPGTKIIRMRLQTSAKAFSFDYFMLRWRNGPSNPFTKIYSYISGDYFEITNSANHLIDSLDHPLPVELKDFTFGIFRNDVRLSWITVMEKNNSGFEIQRKNENGDVWRNIGFVSGKGTFSGVADYTYIDKNLMTGSYIYRLKQLDYNGNFTFFNLENKVVISPPELFNLSQNYPNPFNPVTNIEFSIPYDSYVRIILYSLSGKEIKNIFDGNKNAGYYTVKFESENLPSGVYFYRMEVHPGSGNSNVNKSSISSSKKLVILK